MKNNILTYCLFFVFSVFGTSSIFADGTLTDGDATLFWATNSFGGMDWVLEAGAPDQTFQLWFWYRVDGQTNETIFGIPTMETFVDNVATLTFTNVDGNNFDAIVTLTMTDAPGNAAQFATEVTIINNTGAPLDIDVFTYLDLDKSGSVVNDAMLTGPNTMEISNPVGGDTCEFQGVDADAYQVDTWPTLGNLLNDGFVTDFANSGLPVVSSDWTGAFQWSLSIPTGAEESILSGLGGNQPFNAPMPPSNNCDADGGTLISGN